MAMLVVIVVCALLLVLCAGAAIRFVGAIFFSECRKAIAERPFLHVLWLAAAGATGYVAMFMPVIPTVISAHLHAQNTRVRAELALLATACSAYALEYNSYPQGDNAKITQTLLGNNARGIVFIVLREGQRSQRSEVVDPWGTPFRFTLNKGQPPSIRSAGRDRVFDDEDDLVCPPD